MMAPQNTAPRLRRAAFTWTQRTAAAQAGFISEAERARRTPMITHPIDNVEPNVLADRDDGVFVETTPMENGHTRVHITIADVATHVPAGSPLADLAHTRAFTEYRPWGNDTMYPPDLEARMSLEHGKERLGFTVTIELDQQFQPVHTAFQRNIVTSDCKHYDAVNAAMQDTPQFQAMAEIAAGIRTHYLSKTPKLLEDSDNNAPFMLHLTTQQIEARRMVAAYMLLANRAVADLFKNSRLPFVYRNLQRTTANARAAYSTNADGHDDMAADQAYCHFTSPIRRGADTLCQHMAHYALDREKQLAQGLAAQFPNVDVEAIHHALWADAPAWLASIATQKPQALATQLASIARTLDKNTSVNTTALQPLAQQTCAQRPPYTPKILEKYAQQINHLNGAEQPAYASAWADPNKRATATAKLGMLTAELLHDATKDNLSLYLEQAALTGNLPETLRQECIARIKQNNLNLARDGLTMMLNAPYAQDEGWNQLKRRMARALKHEPGHVNSILEMAARQHLLPHFTLAETQLPLEDSAAPIHSAIATFTPSGSPHPVCAPYYSIGHDKRAAESHARYSFIEHFAFGQLVPLNQRTIPNLLYAELDMENASKRQVVERMAAEVGARFTLQADADHPAHLVATIAGGTFTQPLILSVTDKDSAAEAEASLLRRILRDATFKSAVSNTRDPALQHASAPQNKLADWVTSQGGSVNITYEETRSHKREKHHCHITVTMEGRSRTFSATGHNRDRALVAACSKALHKLGVPDHMPTGEPQHQSWAGRVKGAEAGLAAKR